MSCRIATSRMTVKIFRYRAVVLLAFAMAADRWPRDGVPVTRAPG
jgi:hypothetical protein